MIYDEVKAMVEKAIKGYAGDKREMVKDIFKMGVVDTIIAMKRNSEKEDGLEFDAYTESKNVMIAAFRAASLDEGQHSVEEYESIFEDEIKAILEFCGSRHGGGNLVTCGSNTLVDLNGQRL